MFKSLRIKLTLINIAVLGFILVFVFSGIYILMAKGMVMESYRMMRLISMQNRFPSKQPAPPLSRHSRDSFFIKIDGVGNIIGMSQNIPINEDELQVLLDRTQKQQKDEGSIKISNEAYRFLKTSFNNKKDSVIVYLNFQGEKETLKRLATIFIIIGLSSIGLSFFASLFLANKALIPIKDAWEKQKNFVADASHELRTPLASIQTNLEAAMSNPDETVGSQSKWLNNILAENQRMSKLVGDLLLLARADSYQEMMNMSDFLLDKALKEAVLPLEPTALKKRIEFMLSLEEDVHFYGDEARIKQLAVILVDNAIKYTPINGKVELILNNQNNNVEIIVTDTGDGISEDDRSKIFERFYRVDKARARESGGSGLGLSIAEWIVKGHGGSIIVYSGSKKGSTFKTTLPKRRK